MSEIKAGDVVVIRDSRGPEDEEYANLVRWFGLGQHTVTGVRETKIRLDDMGDDDWWLTSHFKKC